MRHLVPQRGQPQIRRAALLERPRTAQVAGAGLHQAENRPGAVALAVDRESGPLRVAIEVLLLAHEMGDARIAAAPQRQPGIGDVLDRVADVRQLPVEDRDEVAVARRITFPIR